jgi:signal transduction histidine kinase
MSSSMLTSIGFVVLILVVTVLIMVDVSRTPTEASARHLDQHVRDPGRVIAGARTSAAGAHAFPREPTVRERLAPAGGMRTRAGPAETDSSFESFESFERTDRTARAFDQMRREISQITADDAALRGKLNATFVNLSRRTQALVERQLRLIEALEHGEHDEQRLTSLSKLNRVAMRIHRNSQNLLVLAGNEPVTGWNQPVTLAQLVEAALSEVEDYERVSFEIQPDIAVRGPAVEDLVHLLVELIDNATSFSAAEMPVHITGHILTTGGALVDITDRGIGMAANEMTYANQQLDNPPAPDIDVPKWMGLLVVGRLAARHGIRVRLNQADLGGLTALVWLPDEILMPSGAPADPGYAVTRPSEAAASSAGLAAARVPAREASAPQPDPAWSARGAQTVVQAEPLTAQTRGLPIFDEIDPRWTRGSHEVPGPADPTAAGLPRRPPPAQGSRAAPRPPSAAPNRPGRHSWAAPADEASPDGADES